MLFGSMLLVAVVIGHYTWMAIDNLDDVSLQIQAGQIADHARVDGGRVELQLPPALEQAYRDSVGGYLYAVVDLQGNVLVDSGAAARRVFAALPRERLQEKAVFFRLIDAEGQGAPYYALLTALPKADGLRVIVAQGAVHGDVYVDTLLSEFATHIGWTLPVILVAALLISVWTIRSSLRPIKDLSARALMIGPETRNLRLPIAEVAEEILPLIRAVNSALDRLEAGFEMQRRFTANAAHELRTPLAVLTARVAELDNTGGGADQLAIDIERMNRLVAQLLLVSRLEAKAIRLDDDVDLNQVAADVVAFLAPLAIGQRRSIALQAAPQPVLVRGGQAALEDALRNLVENALHYTPPNSEVTVTVGADGSIAVRDCGPGVPEELRERIFERFWRGRGHNGRGAGLGLAIVAETMRSHGGSISVATAPQGGALFIMHLPLSAGSKTSASLP